MTIDVISAFVEAAKLRAEKNGMPESFVLLNIGEVISNMQNQSRVKGVILSKFGEDGLRVAEAARLLAGEDKMKLYGLDLPGIVNLAREKIVDEHERDLLLRVDDARQYVTKTKGIDEEIANIFGNEHVIDVESETRGKKI